MKPPLRYFISDMALYGGSGPLLESIRFAMREGVDLVQIREKQLPARELADLVRAAMALPNPHSSRILVNSRMDVALACGAHGLHLPSQSPPASAFRPLAPSGFQIAVSCHSLEEATQAEAGGADFIVFGPVFAAISKAGYGPPVGLEALQSASAAVSIPVLALGGVTEANTPLCISAGAAGTAGISMFKQHRHSSPGTAP